MPSDTQALSAPRDRPTMVVLRALKLGDLLVAVPALRGLRRSFPCHRIVLATPAWLAPIVGLIDAVDELLPLSGLDEALEVETGSVDIAVNLHGNGPESQARVAALEARTEIVHRSEARPEAKIDWVEDLHERDRWARLVNAYGADADPLDVHIARPEGVALPSFPFAVVHVGASGAARLWPAERFAEVAKSLVASGLGVLVTGGSDDVARARAVVTLAGLPETSLRAGRAELDEFAGLTAAAEVVVTADTGAAHLASAYGTPSVIIFGPALPERWGPPPGPHVVLTDPASRRGDLFASTPDPALLAVTPGAVCEAVESVRHVRKPDDADR